MNIRAHREKIDSRLLSYLLISPRKRVIEKGLKEGVLIHIGEKKKRTAKVTKLYRNWFMTENEIGVKEGFLYTDMIHSGSIK